MLAFAIHQAVIITPSVVLLYPDVDATLLATVITSNGTVFPLFFAIPLMIPMQEELGFKTCA